MKELLLTIDGKQSTINEIQNLMISNLIGDYIDTLYKNGHIDERPTFTLEEYDGAKKIDLIKQEIKEEYYPENCGLTEECSEGNYSDVFADGEACGASWMAYRIGEILEMDLEKPEEQKYSWED